MRFLAAPVRLCDGDPKMGIAQQRIFSPELTHAE
jgi:hypothetical protein